MTPERWKQIDELAQAALEREGDERAAFLAEACAGDDELRREVESHIAYQQQASKFLEEPVFKQAADLGAQASLPAFLIADPQTDTESMEGRTVSHYSILRKLGAGGMGEVYLAQDTTLNRKVAIKFLSQSSVAGEQAKKRLVREAKAAAALDHPHICAVYEVGEDAGYSFIVMQYVEGETLASRIQRRPIEIREALGIAVQIADALSEAHSHRIIHRDVKPQNVMLTPSGQVKVLDFGLAKLNSVPADPQLSAMEGLSTKSGVVKGTVSYMSPEQARGEKVDERTDIFSLGVMFYEMIARRAPFAGATTNEVIASILRDEPLPLGECAINAPRELEHIVSRALRKDRNERYQTGDELLADLKELQGDLEFAAEERRRSDRARQHGKLEQPVPSNSDTLVVPVAPVAAEFTAARTLTKIGSPSRLRRRPAVMLVAFGFLALTLAGVGLYLYLRSKPAPFESLAVLPFSADPQNEYLADGLTESVINNLSRLPNLRVTARAWAFNYKGKELNPRRIGEELNVRVALTGKVALHDDILTIQVDMVDTASGTQMWGQRYQRKLADIFAVQEEMGSQIAEKLRLRFNGEVIKRDTENQQAYQLFLKARYHWDKHTPEGRQKAVASFEQALVEDPSYALAYSWLATAYIHLGTNGELLPHEAKRKAQDYALQALKLDEAQDLAHYALGAIKLFYEWDLVGAERELKRAIDLNPSNMDGRLAYAYYLLFVGRTDEAVAEVQREQQLDPLSLLLKTSTASMLYYARRYDEAIAQCRNALELEPNFSSAHYWLALLYLATSKPAEAIAEMKQWIRLSGRNEKNSPDLAILYAASKQPIEARRILKSRLAGEANQDYADPFDTARIYTALGDKDQTFAFLEKAYANHSLGMMWLKGNPQFDSLHDDQRFHDLLQRVWQTP